jgi:hypothetical protein
MLVLIKNYFIDHIPTKEDLTEAKQLCINEDCVIDLKWCPSVFAGWHHVYIDKNSNIDNVYETQIPKVYAV